MRGHYKSQLLLLIALTAAIPRVYLGATHHIDYDGYWHVFIAMQDEWEIFWREYQANFHPPLFYLLLKVFRWFGQSALVYRGISILTGVGSVFVVGKIAEKLSLWKYTAAIAALSYGVALPSIIISNEVRSYMLCVFFLLASFYYFLDILDGTSHLKSRIGFAAFAVIALGSHYSAYFYVFACGLVAGVFGILAFRRKFLSRVVLDLATFLPIASVGALTYYTHAQPHATIAANHLSDFYFQPGGGERLTAFLFRNAQYLFNSFSPVEVVTRSQFGIVLAFLVFAAGVMVYLIRRPLVENARAAATVLTAAFILGSIIAGGIMGKYPFGGYLRQQFILFPFAVICGCILLDRSASAIRDRRLNTALVVAVTLLILGVSAAQFYRFPKNPTEIYTAEMTRFRETFPSHSAVYVDQFSLIIFFAHYHHWNWEFSGRNSAVPSMEIYRVSKGTEEFLLIRDKARWNADGGDYAWYAELAALIRSQPLPSITTFNIRQYPEPIHTQGNATREDRIFELASAAKLCVNKHSLVTALSTYVELTQGPCRTKVQSRLPSLMCC